MRLAEAQWSRSPVPPGGTGALAVVCLGVAQATLGSTIVNIALPQIGHNLHAGLAGLQWVANAYMVVYAALLLPAGGLTGRVGRRGMFVGGAAVLTIGGVWCAAAPSFSMLLTGRALQAIGSAALVPATLALIPAEFADRSRRARAIGWWAGAASVGMAAGPLAGGVVLAAAGWRAVFVFVAAVGAITLALGWRLIDPVRHGAGPRSGSTDTVGAIAVTVFLAALSFGLVREESAGWGALDVVYSFMVAAFTLAVFVLTELIRTRRGAEPLMRLSVWRVPQFAATSIGGIVYGVALFGVLFYLSLFLQRVQGRSALDSGLVFLPLSGTMAIAGPVAGRLTAAFGQRVIAVAGTVIAAAGVLSLAAIAPDTGVASLAVRFAITGVGMGLMAAPLSSAMIASLPSGSAGFASAMYNSSRQVGGVLGITLLGVILAAHLHAASGQQAVAFTGGLRLALLAAGLALVASAVTSGALIRRRPVAPLDEDGCGNRGRSRPLPEHAAVRHADPCSRP